MKPHEFYEILPDGRYRFRVDHHLINDYNTCDRLFKFRHIPDAVALPAVAAEGEAGAPLPTPLVWAPKTLNIKIAIGQWWSRVMELFYREFTFGTYPSDHLMYKFASEAWHELDMDRYAVGDNKDVYDKFGGVEGGRLMALEYREAFGAHHFREWQVVGAELGFGWSDELPIGEDNRVVVYYGGKPDLVIRDVNQNMIIPVDFKSKDAVQGNASVAYKPHPQTAGYIFAVRTLLQAARMSSTAEFPGQTTKCIVMVCARFRPTEKPRDGVRKPRFLPVYVNYTEQEIEEWRQGVIEKCRRLRDSIERNIWTPRESACHLYYHGCMFRRVCTQPPNLRSSTLRSDFVQVQPWQPYSPEED